MILPNVQNPTDIGLHMLVPALHSTDFVVSDVEN